MWKLLCQCELHLPRNLRFCALLLGGAAENQQAQTSYGGGNNGFSRHNVSFLSV